MLMAHQDFRKLRADCQMRRQRRHGILEDHRQLRAADAVQLGWRKAQDILPLESDASVDGRIAVEQTHGGHENLCLAGPGLADDADALALLHIQGDLAHGGNRRPTLREADAQLIDGKYRDHSLLLHIESVAQSVAKDIERQQQQRQQSAGYQQNPRCRLHLAGAFGDERAQARMRFLNTQAKEAQETLEHDDLRYGERRVHDDRPDGVRDDVLDDDAGSARPRRHRGFDEFPMPDAQGFPAHDSRHRQPANRAHRYEQQGFAAAEYDGQEYDEEDQWQSAQDLDDSHHHMIGASAGAEPMRAAQSGGR